MATTATPNRYTDPAIVIIPARLESTRLPRKLLLRETGHSLIHHTYWNARRATEPMDVVVATDSGHIAEDLRGTARAFIDNGDFASGTDRVASLASEFRDYNIIVNVQGDEPEVDPLYIDWLIDWMRRSPTLNMATLATACSPEDFADPNCVKVLINHRGFAEDFYRIDDHLSRYDLRHIGVYAYRHEFLQKFASWKPGAEELREGLEQLRAIEHEEPIFVDIVPGAERGINTGADYRAFVERYKQRQQGSGAFDHERYSADLRSRLNN